MSTEGLAVEGAATAPVEGVALEKRSFLKLPLEIDLPRLLDEYRRIPEEAWGVSHWDVHCSIDVLLLRGGGKGDQTDFTTDSVVDNPILDDFPYISGLIRPDGPLGGAIYAFVFRTKPGGITRIHLDNQKAWYEPFRVHVPIVSNDGAFLLSEGKAQHFGVGEAWTFDNQSLHSVVNGDSTRVHLIMDVLPNPKLVALLQNAEFHPGVDDPERWAVTGGKKERRTHPLVYGNGEPITIREKKEFGLKPGGFATRITELGLKAKLLRLPFRVGDVIVSVDGVEESNLSRTALDHIRLRHQPGETIRVDLLRNGARVTRDLHLKPAYYLSPMGRLRRLLRRHPAEPRQAASY